MPLQILKVITCDEDGALLDTFRDEKGVLEYWSETKNENNKSVFNFLVLSEHLQNITDKIQSQMNSKKDWRIIVSSVDTSIPRYQPDKELEEDENSKKIYGSLTRETLYDQIMNDAETDTDFYILVFLSTIVTAIGLVTNNLAVIIGAMVIAPLLAPNLALSFGVTLGDKEMVKQALKANGIGIGLTLLISVIGGFFIPVENFITSHEFLQRTDVGYGGIVLALASGAAAVLSLTGGVSSTMVGVMVAVALMPPAVAAGLAFGARLTTEGLGALLLLAINITCVNLAAKAIFSLKGIKPRTWYQRKKSKQSLKLSIIFWAVWLLILSVVIYLRHN